MNRNKKTGHIKRHISMIPQGKTWITGGPNMMMRRTFKQQTESVTEAGAQCMRSFIICCLPQTLTLSSQLRWDRRDKKCIQSLLWKPKRKRHSRDWRTISELYLQECEGVDWIWLVQDSVWWLILLKSVVSSGRIFTENLLITWVTPCFSRSQFYKELGINGKTNLITKHQRAYNRQILVKEKGSG
jgi:hypothetical protein